METILASVVAPAAIDLFKNLFGSISRKVAGLSADDQIKLENANVDRLKAVSLLDNPYGTPSQWVVDLRGSARYITAGLAVITGGVLLLRATTPELQALAFELVGMPFGFIFGERMYLGMKGPGNK